MQTFRLRLHWVLLRVALTIVGFGLVFHLFGCQQSLIYYPQTATSQQLARSAERHHLQEWTDSEGDRIGWFRPGESSGGSVLITHGNAGYALHRWFYVDAFRSAARNAGDPLPAVYILEYPGYGDRPGRPSERTILEAVEAAWEVLVAKQEGPFFLLGESIGSGGASHLAGLHGDGISGILLITPFDRLASVVRHHGTFLGQLLISERYDNVKALEHFRGRLAIVLAENDRVVPARFGKALYESFESGNRSLWIQRDRDHNTLDLEPGLAWWDEVWAFLRHGKERSGNPSS